MQHEPGIDNMELRYIQWSAQRNDGSGVKFTSYFDETGVHTLLHVGEEQVEVSKSPVHKVMIQMFLNWIATTEASYLKEQVKEVQAVDGG